MWGRRARSAGGNENLWWYCLRHHRVEHGPGCPDDVRLGPYATEEEAAGAPQRAAERTKAWDRED